MDYGGMSVAIKGSSKRLITVRPDYHILCIYLCFLCHTPIKSVKQIPSIRLR